MASNNMPLTLDDQISNIKARDISYRTLHNYCNVINTVSRKNIEIPYDSYPFKYKDYLAKIVQIVKLSEKDKVRFRFNPKRASNAFYGTTEYWFLLLRLNECISICDFDQMDYMKIYDPQQIKSYINEIMYLEGLV